MHNKAGRPKGTRKKCSKRQIRLAHEAEIALSQLVSRLGWTATRAIEKSLLFAASHRSFGHLQPQ